MEQIIKDEINNFVGAAVGFIVALFGYFLLSTFLSGIALWLSVLFLFLVGMGSHIKNTQEAQNRKMLNKYLKNKK